MPYIIAGAVVLLIAVWLIITYNRLVSEKLKVENQWSQIDIVLKQRADTVPNLVSVVSAYAQHEKDVFASVTSSREKYMNAKTPSESVAAYSTLSSDIAKLMAVAENYPELKANGNFLDLQKQLAGLEGKLADFRQFFNDTVMRYNNLVMIFPSSIAAKLFHFEKKDFFTVSDEEKASPRADFR
ncbi:MAG TPA: LemA family protein [Bacillota bacterium]|nr:LemA family protein [Bacillota bacterium]